MKDNVVGHPGYHVTKNGEIYSYSRGAWKLRKTPSALMARGEYHSNASITNQTRNMIVDLRLNYKVPEFKISSIFGISKRHISKIISQYKEGIRWDN